MLTGRKPRAARAVGCIVASLALLALNACGCGPQVGAAVEGKVAGRVIKGPVAGALVTAFAVDSAGRRAERVGDGASEDDGAFAVTIGAYKGALLVCATSGTYVEEATGGLVQLGPNELCALVEDHELGRESNGVIVTPLTTLHAALTACFAGAEREANVVDASARADLRLNDFFGAGIDAFAFRTQGAFDVTAGTAPSLTPDVWHGVLLAGLSESARQISIAAGIDPGVRVTAATLTSELVRDIDDGACVFDGLGAAGVQLAQEGTNLSANTLRGAPAGLAQSIERFLEGERNASGILAASVRDLTRNLSTHTSEIFGGGEGGDLDPPVVTIVQPLAGAVSGTPTIVVNATDATAVSSLAFTAPAALVGAGTLTCAQPTECRLEATLNTGLFPEGALTISARAADEAGNADTASVAVNVNNSVPVITVTSPTAGTVAGIVNLTAQVDDAEGIETFAVAVAGATFATACAPPNVVTNCDQEPDPKVIDIPWDTRLVNEGPATVTFTAADTSGNPAFASVDVVVDNLAVGTISGTIEVGAPVGGATVEAFELQDDGSTGASLGTDSSVLEDGAFQIQNASSYAGPILVMATGGSFVDVASGQTLAVNNGQALSAMLEAAVPGGDSRVNVNAWTTLAAKRTRIMRQESASLAAAITFNRGLFERHFRRPGQALPILQTLSADLTDDVLDAESSDPALLALAHAGLSRFAAELCDRTAVAVGAITMLDVLDVLLADLDDGLLDGAQEGVRLDLDPGALEQADSYVLRRSLASSIYNFTKDVPLNGVLMPRNTSGVDGDSLSQAGKILDDIALNADSNLFPFEDAPLPFDRAPPGIDFLFLPPNNEAVFGDALSGLVTIVGTATDSQSRLARFDLLEPTDLFDVLASSIADMQVQIGTERAPNAAAAAAACGIQLGDPPLDIPTKDTQVCLCAEAADEVDNVYRELWCFTRPPPVVTFTGATPAEAASVTGTVVVSASATTGFDLLDLVLLDGLVDEPEAPTDDAASVVVTFPTSFVDAVNKPFIVVRAQATDIAGQFVEATRSFTRPEPTVNVTLPDPAVAGEVFSKCGGSAANPCPAARHNFPVTLAGNATSGYDLQACTYNVAAPGISSVLSGNGTFSGTTCTVQKSLGEAELADGEYVFQVRATDVAGRLVSRSDPFRKDTVVEALSVVAPLSNTHTNAASLSFTGTVSDSQGISKVEVVLTGANVTTLAASLSGSTWTATLANPAQGSTQWYVRVVDSNGNLRDTSTAARTFFADRGLPTLTTASQPQVRNEPVNGPFVGSGTVAANTLTYTPSGGLATPAWAFSGTPSVPASPTPATLHRWVTLRDDTTGSPPAVRINVADTGAGATTDPSKFVVKWGLDTSCPTQAQATNVPTRSNADFTAVITDATTAVDLAAQSGAATLCVAFYVTDEAGNTAQQFAFFKWNSVVPPVSVDLGGSTYNGAVRADDVRSFGIGALDAIFHLTDADLSTGYVVDHAVLYNPHASAVDVKLTFGGTVTMLVNFIEQLDVSNEEVGKFWGNTAHDLLDPGSGTATDGCRADTFNSGPVWSTIRNTGGIIKAPLVTTTSTCNTSKQSIDPMPTKYRSTTAGDPRTLPRTTDDGISTGNVAASINNGIVTGFSDLTRTLRVFRLNSDGSLGTEIAVSSGFVNLPSRTLAVALWKVKHTAPSTSQYQMDCSTSPSDFDAACPLFSNNLLSSAFDASPAPSAVPNLTGLCVMKKMDGSDGCATIFQTADSNEFCDQGTCYVDKAFWWAQRMNARANSGSSLSQSYRLGGVTSDWTNRTVDRSNEITRSVP